MRVDAFLGAEQLGVDAVPLALTGNAQLAGCTRVVAFPAVCFVGLQRDTGILTHDLSTEAAEGQAFALETAFTDCALRAAFPAVRRIGIEIGAELVADLLCVSTAGCRTRRRSPGSAGTALSAAGIIRLVVAAGHAEKGSCADGRHEEQDCPLHIEVAVLEKRVYSARGCGKAR